MAFQLMDEPLFIKRPNLDGLIVGGTEEIVSRKLYRGHAIGMPCECVKKQTSLHAPELYGLVDGASGDAGAVA